ncbi:MAG: glycosyltransferase family 2 protein [Bacteroidales bacterium]|nr:glycosyltransferase family 2 protein [Bacteroidales bacterium]
MKIIIVVPCYNEEAVLEETTRRLTDLAARLCSSGKVDEATVLYVDDGSRDRTWEMISRFAARQSGVAGLKLAHNVGHQQALWAGLEYAAAHADASVSIDADLQDDVEAIEKMVDSYRSGADVVFGVRRERKTDTWFKRTTALAFYSLMRSMNGNMVYNHADFRLMSRRALQALISFPERNLFLRGMVASLGFVTDTVYYDRSERFAGESKYPLGKMLAFAIDGITSFSVRPLRYISLLGVLFMCISLCAIVYGVVAYIQGRAIAGWTSLLVSLWFIGGAILLACGIIGEYVGKIYTEVKRRPRYFVEQRVGIQEIV